MTKTTAIVASDITSRLTKALKPFTVIGRYPNGHSVISHVWTRKATEARRRAVQNIAFQVYGGRISKGLDQIYQAIRAVSKDFSLVAVLNGHHKPNMAAKRVHFYEAK